MSIINYLDDMALAIKEKSGYKGKMTYVEMPEKIRELAFEDPMVKYDDYSLLTKQSGGWSPFEGSAAVLELVQDTSGSPYEENTTYKINWTEETKNFGVLSNGYNSDTGQISIDPLDCNHIETSGAAYVIYSPISSSGIYEMDYLSGCIVESSGQKAGQMGIIYDKYNNKWEKLEYGYATYIASFDSSGTTFSYIHDEHNDVFYKGSNAVIGETVGWSGSYSDSPWYYFNYSDLQNETTSTTVHNNIKGMNYGFWFVNSNESTYINSGQTSMYGEDGELEDNCYLRLYKDSYSNEWYIEYAEAPTPVEESGYYYISFDSSTSTTTYTPISNSGVVYLHEYGNYEWLINGVEYNKTYFCSTNCGRSLSELSTGIFIIDDNGYPSQIYDETSIDTGDVFTVSSGKLYKQQYINEVTLYSYNGKSFDAMEEGLFYISDDSGSIGYYLNPDEHGVYEYDSSEYYCLKQVQYGINYIDETGSKYTYVNEGSCYQYMGNGSFSDLPTNELIYIASCEGTITHTSLESGIYSYAAGGLNFNQINLPTKGNPTEFTYDNKTYQITDITPNAAV